ncbi:Endonuclease/exonuclease/phosphatase [Leucosporidium creatinivorum]|uniref:CCR4-Not complex 3'-5'-exoribonuclease subunit Ccr4 n=1 Tax=Leucosporidium creatinivorum TaxID=106004 RepID=A0A1Y2G613_9BASI|nr:Endonuclease/exonuclease/phosphatase [Leucosporidium creatinivorum]
MASNLNASQQPHHPQHSFSYPGPPASPAYSANGPSHPQHHNSLPPHSHHSPSPHPGQGPPLGHHPHQPPPHHLSNQQQGGSGSPHPANNGGPVSAHWQQQLSLAHISRQSNSPHHNARAAHLAARGQTTTSSAIAITDPNRPAGAATPTTTAAKVLTYGAPANGLHRKDGSGASNSAELALSGGSDLANKGEKNTWTTIDMGGMNLKNISVELFRYTFLTTLYIPHNSLTTLPSSISNLVNLTLLDASSNKLSSLPVELGLLTHLRDLFLFDNHLTSLPPELGTLHLLDTLGIEGNPLPETIRSLLEKEGTSSLIAYLRDSCPVPLPPPERDWITIEPDSFPNLNSTKPPEETFSLLCYNILCEKYATGQMYGYTPSWALSWDYRKELILQEVMNYSADILCLQEVDVEQYETYFLEHLQDQDYDGIHYPKSRARTMSGDERRRVDGCAIFYKNTTFALVEQQLIEFNQIAMRRPDFKKTEDMFNRVMTKDNIAVVTLLEHRKSGARLIIANAHLTWDHEFRDVKLVQVAMLMDELSKIANDFAKLPARLNLGEGYDKAPTYANGSKIPTIVCGDYNSVPDSGVYEFLSRGEIPSNHADFMSHVYGAYTSEGLSHKLALKSAYSHVGEIEFTNYTPGFQGVIDYIFYSNSLSVNGLLGPVDDDYLKTVVGFPNAHWPSDHISLLAEFKIKN